MVFRHLPSVGVQRRAEGVADFSVLDNMGAHISVTGLKSLVSDIFESHSGGIVSSGLLGVSNPESDMVKSIEDSNSGSLSRLSVIYHLSVLIKDIITLLYYTKGNQTTRIKQEHNLINLL
jgi:hypothetical protein